MFQTRLGLAWTDFGNRCPETGMLEYDHIDGWARTHTHDPDRIRLRCHAHNQHAADKVYGREFMERARTSRRNPTRPGAGHGASSNAGLDGVLPLFRS